MFVIFVGDYPYSEMKGHEVHKYVSDGHRLERTSRVSLELYVKSNLIFIHTRRQASVEVFYYNDVQPILHKNICALYWQYLRRKSQQL